MAGTHTYIIQSPKLFEGHPDSSGRTVLKIYALAESTFKPNFISPTLESKIDDIEIYED